MHVRTNIELDAVGVATLAICPILFLSINSTVAFALVVISIVAFLISVFICSVFNRFLSNNIKIFLTAFISVFVVTIANFLFDSYDILGLESSNIYFLGAMSSVIMTIDIYYIDTKAVAGSLLPKTFLMIALFFLLSMILFMIKEFLSYGTLFGTKLFSFSGNEFFEGAVFSLVLLGLLSAIFDGIYRSITKVVYENQMEYEKYVKQVRNEKIFQYDSLRRKKLLSSPVEVRNISTDEADIIKTKSDTNETIETNSDSEAADTGDSGEDETPTKRKKNKKLKVSKEAKDEQKRNKRKGGDSND